MSDLGSSLQAAVEKAKQIASALSATTNSGDNKNLNRPPSNENSFNSKLEQARMIAGNMSKKLAEEGKIFPGQPGSAVGVMGNEVTDMLMIPSAEVGFVIGKNGSTITYLQAETHCRMFMIQDGAYINASEKPLSISGDAISVEKAKEYVLNFLKEKRAEGGFGVLGPGEIQIQLLIPRDAVAIIIGKQGENIKKIAQSTGCRIRFKQECEPNGDRICIFEGTKEQIANGRASVKEQVQAVLMKKATGVVRISTAPGVEAEEISITSSRAGALMGKSGDYVKHIALQTGTNIEPLKSVPDDHPTLPFLITGTRGQIEQVKGLLRERVGEEHVICSANTPSTPAIPYFQNSPITPIRSMPWADLFHADPSMLQKQSQTAVLEQQQQQYYQMMAASYYQTQMVPTADAQYYPSATIPGDTSNQMGAYGAAAQGAEFNSAWVDYYQKCADYYLELQKNPQMMNAANSQLSAEGMDQSQQPIDAETAGAWASYYQQCAQYYAQMMPKDGAGNSQAHVHSQNNVNQPTQSHIQSFGKQSTNIAVSINDAPYSSNLNEPLKHVSDDISDQSLLVPPSSDN